MTERREEQGFGQQQSSQSDSRQQQQFDSGSRQAGGGGFGSEGGLADRIRPHQDVVDQSGALVGTVDHVDGDRIKLTRQGSQDGEHHYVALSQVAGIEGDQVRLHDRGDASSGGQAGSRQDY